MKSVTISERDNGTRLDKFILKTFDKMPKSLMFKEIRKKNIKVNRKRCTPEQILNTGDILELYLKDDVLQPRKKHYDFLKASKELDIIYEDENIILINKQSGVLCHASANDYTDNIVARLQRYMYENGSWSPEKDSFTPCLANRIDRNTGGIVIGAKNITALKSVNREIKNGNIEKYYLALVHGKMEKNHDILYAYHIKNEKTNTVTVKDEAFDGAKRIITEYTVIDFKNEISLVEIRLHTGRTHQIRAHFAHIGHPLIADGKYGNDKGRYRQALYSYKLAFHFPKDDPLAYLDGREFTARDVKFANDFKKGKLQ